MLVTQDQPTQAAKDSQEGIDLFEVVELDEILDLAQNKVNVCVA